MIIQSHQLGIFRLDAMLFNKDNRLPKRKIGGGVINRQPKAKRSFDGHKICRIAFIELEELHCVCLRDGPIIPMCNIIVKWK